MWGQPPSAVPGAPPRSSCGAGAPARDGRKHSDRQRARKPSPQQLRSILRHCAPNFEKLRDSAYVKLVKHMLGIRLEPELEEKLESLAKQTGRSKSYYAREAIRQYLEDREDYLKGIAALERREPTITLAELERRLGLAD